MVGQPSFWNGLLYYSVSGVRNFFLTEVDTKQEQHEGIGTIGYLLVVEQEGSLLVLACR